METNGIRFGASHQATAACGVGQQPGAKTLTGVGMTDKYPLTEERLIVPQRPSTTAVTTPPPKTVAAQGAMTREGRLTNWEALKLRVSKHPRRKVISVDLLIDEFGNLTGFIVTDEKKIEAAQG